MAANYFDIMPDILLHFVKQVYLVTPVGKNAKPWKHFEADVDVLEIGNRMRLFDVRMDNDLSPSMPNAIGAGTTDYDCFVNIDICYESQDDHTILGLNDFEAIRKQIMASDTSALTGYNFARFEEIQWIDSEQEDSKYRYMRIPIMVRVTITH